MGDLRETDESLTLALSRHGGAVVELRWRDITGLVAFKQDLFNPLIVILEIATTAGRFEIAADDCGGYELFTHVLRRHLGAVAEHDEWWPRVANPLTSHREIALYRRVEAG